MLSITNAVLLGTNAMLLITNAIAADYECNAIVPGETSVTTMCRFTLYQPRLPLSFDWIMFNQSRHASINQDIIQTNPSINQDIIHSIKTSFNEST